MSTLFLMAFTLGVSVIACAQDGPKNELDRAKIAYENEKVDYREAVIDAFERRAEALRKAGDKKALDQLTADRSAFENWHAVPTVSTPVAAKRKMAAFVRVETALKVAIKNAIRAKNDATATALERELLAFQASDWPHLKLENFKRVGDAFQVPKHTSILTKNEFSGPIEINAIARTEKDNIRFRAYRGSAVIFNWEGSPGQLRMARPDGSTVVETGSIAAALDHPLRAGTWYKLRWRLTNQGTEVYVDDQIVFREEKNYDLSTTANIELRSENSLLEIKDFHVISIKGE